MTIMNQRKTNLQKIEISTILLEWSDWCQWPDFTRDLRRDPHGVSVPSTPGVYEVKYENAEERLTIGKASNLRLRVKQGLVKGKVPHLAGRRIREEETDQLVIRWAETDRPSAVEEELHRQYMQRFGRLPKYTKRT